IFVETGILFFFPTEEPYVRDSIAAHRQFGLPTEVLDQTEMGRRFPMIDFDGIEVGLFEPGFGALMARRAVLTLVERFVRNGGIYLTGNAVAPSGQSPVLDALTLSPGEVVQADHFAFATGAWLP